MANWSYYRPGVSDRAPLNLTNYDGKTAPQVSLQSPFTATLSPASPYVRLSCEEAFLKIQHGRTIYRVSSADITSPFLSGEWHYDFEDEFPTTRYTVLVTVEDPNFSQNSPAMTPPSILVTSKTTTSVKGRLSFYPHVFGLNRDLTINVIGWGD